MFWATGTCETFSTNWPAVRRVYPKFRRTPTSSREDLNNVVIFRYIG
jgi:hypothetical protein